MSFSRLYNIYNKYVRQESFLALSLLLTILLTLPSGLSAQDNDIPDRPVEPGELPENVDPAHSADFATDDNRNITVQGHQDAEIHMTPRNSGSNELSAFDVYWVFAGSQGRLFVKTDDPSMDIYDGSSWQHLDVGDELNGHPNDMTEAADESYWFATNEGLTQFSSDLVKTEQIHATHYSSYDTLTRASEHIAVDQNGMVWAAHHSEVPRREPLESIGGISVYHPDQDSLWYDREFLRGAEPNVALGHITDLMVHSNGNIWASVAPTDSTEGGILVIPPERDTLWSHQKATTNLPSDNVNGLTQDGDGDVWTCFYRSRSDSTTGAARYDGSSWTAYTNADTPLDVSCSNIKSAPNQPVYYLSSDTTMQLPGSEWEPVTGDVDGRPLVGINSVAFGFNGQTVFSQRYFGSDNWSGGVFLKDGNNWEFMSSTNDGGLFSKHIFGVTVDTANNVWASGFYGVGKYDGSSWTYYNQRDGLAHTYSWKVHAADNGTIWLATTRNGLSYYQNGEFHTYTEYSDTFFGEAIFEDSENNIWFGSFEFNSEDKQPGILKYDGNEFTRYDTTEGVISNLVTAFAEDQNGNVISSSVYPSGQLAMYDSLNDSWSQWSPEEIDNLYSYEIGSGPMRNVWIPQGDSLLRWDGSELWSYDYPEDYTVDAIHIEPDADGRLWLGGETVTVFENGNWHRPLKFDGSWTYDIAHAPNGNTWVGTYGGGLYMVDRAEAVEIPASEQAPSEFSLKENYPNPFNPSTNIKFNLPKSTQVTLNVYNVIGQKVATVVNKQMNAGSHSVQFDGSELSSGVYIYRIQAGNYTQSKKMLLVK